MFFCIILNPHVPRLLGIVQAFKAIFHPTRHTTCSCLCMQLQQFACFFEIGKNLSHEKPELERERE